jgi:DNA (cytosine-5)-methyltransferase 1
MVRVRKYEVDIESLKKCLRNNKNKLTNRQISEILNKPITLVEHWFRKDNCFAIPDADIWFQLKELLNINTKEFDESVTTFEEREGVFEKSNRCYSEEGISPTITCASADEKIIVRSNFQKPPMS